MSRRPSRLYRRTEGLSRPLARVQIGEYQGEGLPGAVFYNDDDIISVKIIHGTSDAAPSLTPARAEIHLRGELDVLNGSQLYVFGPGGLETPNEPSPQWRFTGKVTTQTVHKHPTRPTTVIQAASYVALATGSNVVMDVGAGWTMRQVIETLIYKLQRLSNGEIQYLEPYIYGHETIHANDLDNTVSGVVSKYLTDLGYYVFVMRNGWVKIRDLNRLRMEAEECIAGPGGPFPVPVLRRQVLAPMNLEQTTENSQIGVKIKRRNGSGTLLDGVWTYGEGWQESDDLTVTEWASLDWSHVRYTSGQYRNAVNAYAARLFRTAFRSPIVRFDIPHLLTSGRHGDFEAGKAALRVEPGDWVPFGRDWEPQYRGVKLVTGVTETITPQEWTIELAVQSPQQTIGRYGVPSDPEPLITGYPYDRYDRTTASYPGWTTQDLAGTYTRQYDDIGD